MTRATAITTETRMSAAVATNQFRLDAVVVSGIASPYRAVADLWQSRKDRAGLPQNDVRRTNTSPLHAQLLSRAELRAHD